MTLKKDFSLIIIGNVHSDFTLAPSLIKLFTKLHQEKIPCALMEEGPSDQTLQEARESTLRGIKQSAIFRQFFPELASFYKTLQSNKLVFQHLEKKDLPAIKKIVKTKIMPLIGMNPNDENLAEQVTIEFYRENAYKEEVKLYEKLMQLNIPYTGIDLPSATYAETVIAGSTNPERFVQNESLRIEAMVTNIFNTMNDKLPQGGVVLIPTGATHGHRLAANLLLNHQKNRFNTEQCRITIYAFSLSSFCVDDIKENHGLEITRKVDLPEILDIYQMLPYQNIRTKQEDNGFSLPAIEAIIDKFTLARLAEKGRLSEQSMFAPSVHDQMIKEIKEYCTQHPMINKAAFMGIIEKEKNYSLALRKFCALGNKNLIEILLKYSIKLSIDFHQASSNGKTALDWLMEAKINQDEKNQIKNMVLEKMALISTVVPNA